MRNAEIDKLILAFDALKAAERRMKNKVMPSFLGIGPGRAGSTSLYRLFSEHPEVYVSPVKEVNYFGFRSFNPTRRPKGMTLQDYFTYFSGATAAKAVGEISPSYFILPEALKEIAESLPGCKIISGLRDPLERLVSHYKYHRHVHQCETFDLFISSCKDEVAGMWSPGLAHHWSKPVRILASSMYGRPLSLVKEYFSPDLRMVYLFEDFIADKKVASDILDFVGVNSDSCDVPQESNATSRSSAPEILSESNFKWLASCLSADLTLAEDAAALDLGRYKAFEGSAARAGVQIR